MLDAVVERDREIQAVPRNAPHAALLQGNRSATGKEPVPEPEATDQATADLPRAARLCTRLDAIPQARTRCRRRAGACLDAHHLARRAHRVDPHTGQMSPENPNQVMINTR